MRSYRPRMGWDNDTFVLEGPVILKRQDLVPKAQTQLEVPVAFPECVCSLPVSSSSLEAGILTQAMSAGHFPLHRLKRTKAAPSKEAWGQLLPEGIFHLLSRSW